MSENQFKALEDKDRSEFINQHVEKRSNDPSIKDYMGYYKVPQKAVGIGVPLYLVSNMSKSKGQLPNNQLYGQQSPYGG